jgi:hypothetical protein
VPEDKAHAVLIGDHEVGRTKLDCDARLAMYTINEAIDNAYQAGLTEAKRLLQAKG